MALCGCGIISMMVPSQCWDDDQVYHIGLEVLYVIGFLVRKEFLSQTTVQQLTDEEPRDPDVQERIREYHGFMEYEIGSEDFGISLDRYDSFINYDEEGIAKGDPNKGRYQGTPDSPEIY